jgi:hypothetical protein
MTNIKFEFSWDSFPWRQFREKVCLIQTQIFNFIKYKNFKKALWKQKLLLFSLEVYSLAIKEITQLRLDRKIPGVDNYIIRSADERISLLWLIEEKLQDWVSTITRKVYLIDFLKGKILYWIPTISDRIIQYIWKLVLEPVFNSLFFENQIFLSSINTFLLVKYSLVLKLIVKLQFSTTKLIHLKWDIFSCFNLTFSRIYLLKVLFFPELYKNSMINCFRSKILLNETFFNEDIQCYLHMFHYFVISFGFSGLKYIFLKEIYSQLVSFSNQANLVFCYFNELIFILDKRHIGAYYWRLVNQLWFKRILLNTHVLITNKNPVLGFDFLDWHLTFFQGQICRIISNSKIWLSYKNQFKRVLKSSNYTIYQRIKFLKLYIQIRRTNNWFCSYSILRKEYYILKMWCNKYLKKSTVLSNQEKRYLLQFVFKI